MYHTHPHGQTRCGLVSTMRLQPTEEALSCSHSLTVLGDWLLSSLLRLHREEAESCPVDGDWGSSSGLQNSHAGGGHRWPIGKSELESQMIRGYLRGREEVVFAWIT